VYSTSQIFHEDLCLHVKESADVIAGCFESADNHQPWPNIVCELRAMKETFSDIIFRIIMGIRERGFLLYNPPGAFVSRW